jgi:AraC-like DNA-binding protein
MYDRHSPFALRLIREAVRGLAARHLAAELARAKPDVLTWLTVSDRNSTDAAGDGHFRLVHCATLSDLRRAVRTGRPDAVLVSAALMDEHAVTELGLLVSTFPTVTFAGLVTEVDRTRALPSVQRLGNAGVRTIIDTRGASGWSTLRDTLSLPRLPDPFMRDALAAILADLEYDDAENGVRCSDGCRRFLQAIFAPDPRTAGDIARSVGVPAPTLQSRFARAGLPSPKQYLLSTRILWAAHLAESPALTVTAISVRLGASSPQSFGRMLRRVLGVTATEFRVRFNGLAMRDRFRQTLVIPYRDTLRVFDPVCGAGTRPRLAQRHAVEHGVALCR